MVVVESQALENLSFPFRIRHLSIFLFPSSQQWLKEEVVSWEMDQHPLHQLQRTIIQWKMSSNTSSQTTRPSFQSNFWTKLLDLQMRIGSFSLQSQRWNLKNSDSIQTSPLNSNLISIKQSKNKNLSKSNLLYYLQKPVARERL